MTPSNKTSCLRTKKQQGVALISTLLVFAIASIIAAQLITQSQKDIQRTSWLLQQAQLNQYVFGGEILAKIQLIQALHNDDFLALLELQPSYPAAEMGGSAQIKIAFSDLQGRINLNNIITNSNHAAVVQRYFENIQLSPVFANSIKDWIDSDDDPTNSGNEDFGYRDLIPSYKTASRLLINTSEIASITGYNKLEFMDNLNLFAALPIATSININTAPAEVLSALKTGLDGEQVINSRNNLVDGFESIDSFLESSVTAGLEIDKSLITTNSNYYATSVLVDLNGQRNTLYSRFFYDPDTKKLNRLDRINGMKFSIKSINAEGTEQEDDKSYLIF